tara:strand:- start:268 stop:9519 length:9252 start_codon:yes stop_codon:yes gene_type:complete
MEEKIIIQPVSPDTFEFQDYSNSDQDLLVTNQLDTVFSGSTDYIEAYIYDANKSQITSAIPFTNYKVVEGNVVISPSNDLERLGFDQGEYFISYEFYKPRLGSTLNTRYYISEISSDRTEIRLDTTQIDNALVISSSLEFIQYRDEANYFVDFYLNFGDNQQIIANNLEIDTTDENNPTLLIKLYDPLPSEFDLKAQCSVVEEISTPQSYNVVFPPLNFSADDFNYISGPNYNLSVTNQSGTPGLDYSYNTLLSSDITSSTTQIKSLLNKKEIEISVNYEDYNDFIYFSSAFTRLQNFYYKVGLIQSASAQLGTLTSATTGSVVYSASQASLTNIIDTTIENFDGYEYFLYFNSGSDQSYPKSNTEPPFILYPTGSTEVLNWLGSTVIGNAYYGGQALSASNYDENNQNSLYYAIPEYLRSDPQNVKYELFVDMVGQHYDNVWLYTKNITTRFDADNRLDYGIAKDMVADAIRDFGVKLYSNNFNTDDLYTSFLGLTPSGSSFPFPNMTGSIGGVVNTPSGFEYVDSTISASNDIIPLDDVNKRLYKRIYHNIPYLLKTKGTIAGLRALITSYGIPDTILRINEFGGKDRNNSQDWDLKQDFYNLGLNTTSSGFTSSFSLNTDWGANENSPSSIQFRFKTNGIPSSSNTPTTQSIFESNLNVGSGGPLSRIAMGLDYDESLLTTGTYSGSVESKFKEYGTLKFWPNINTNPENSASLYLPFWDGNWWSVQVDRDINVGNDGGFTLRAANNIGENLGFTGSDTIEGNVTLWENSTEIYWLPQNFSTFAGINYFALSGSLQEVRYYTDVISESVFYDYTMNPYSFEGNQINSAPDQLAFRLSLGSLLNTGSFNNSIHPKVTGSFITTSSFSTNSSASFNATPTWLNNTEDIYSDQTPSGIRNRVTDKIQIENLILPEGDTLSGFRSIQQTSYVSESFTPDVNYLEVAYSPQNQINDDIIGQLGYFNIGDYIGDPRLISSSDKSYPDLDLLRDAYFEKYITNYDVTDFIRLIKFFDNSLFKMIEDFTPARTSLSSGVVIKQHLLERNRQRPAQVTSSLEQYSGSVSNLPKDYSTGSSDFPQYDFSGSSIYVFKAGTGGSFEPFNGLQTYPSGTLGDGPDNRYFLTQSWSESISTFDGIAPLPRVDQREFYNGEFSGSNIPVELEDICSAYFKVGNTVYTYVPVFWSADGNNNTQTITEQAFLDPTNQPPAKYAWFWNDGSNVLYIKMSLESYNGVIISSFIQTVEWIIFAFTNPIDANGAILQGTQTYYLEDVALQPETAASNPESVGSALCYTIPGESSTAVSSADASFYDFNFSASGDYQWHATQDTSADPNPVLDTGISASVPQGYFPLTSTYPTESFFSGWASSNFYTNGTYNAFSGILSDPLNNFNTGSHEVDNTDTTLVSGIDPQSNHPWFMNASPEGENQSWIKIPSESFLDYANIPDSSVGPVATNNYFNIAWTSASSVEPQAVQGVNYYYNASNNAIYMSGSEFQNELKFLNPLYSSSLVHKISGTDQLGTSGTSYTPPGQSNLSIPIDPSRGQELWVYRGESSANVADSNTYRYNRYIHRPFKIYYLTETGSGIPGIPYNLYDPMTYEGIDSSTAGLQSIDAVVPPYYDNQNVSFATMLGTQGDISFNAPTYARPLNDTATLPSLGAVSGSFEIFNEARQVRPFIFTTYRNNPSTSGPNPARGSGSFVAISQSDGTPFALLRMYQNQTPNLPSATTTPFLVTCNNTQGAPFCAVIYYGLNDEVTTQLLNAGQSAVICGDSSRTSNSNSPNYVLTPSSIGTIAVSTNLNGNADPCINLDPSGGGGIGGNQNSSVGKNQIPYFYTFNASGPSVGNQALQEYQIPYGEFFNGENTSSLSLTTGTQPGGGDDDTEIVFPEGGYIFTMSAFDDTTFTNGRTEFGLWTTYGDYVRYDFDNQAGSNANPVTIDYIDNQYQNTSVDVYNVALEEFDKSSNVGSANNSNTGTGNTDSISYPKIFVNEEGGSASSGLGYIRFNVVAGGELNINVSKNKNAFVTVKIFVGDDQTATGSTPSGMTQIAELPSSFTVSTTGPTNFTSTVTNTQQVMVLVSTNQDVDNWGQINALFINLPSPSVIANMGSPEAQPSFTDPFVITGSISEKYANGVEVPGSFATKVTEAYILYTSSLSSSLAGAYVFDVTPTFGILHVTASVVVSSFTDTQAALYGNAIYGSSEYGGGNSGGGTTWTTASLILYTGSANNFPNEMPQIGGDIFAITSSHSTTHNTGERITLMTTISPGELAYNDVIKMALRVGSGSDAPSVVQNSLIVTEYSMSFSSSIDASVDPSIPTIFSDDQNFNYAYDCQPLLNNYSAARINNRLQNVDYTTGLVIPTNWQQVIDFSASRASVPESNYSKTNIINGRYDGSNITSQKYNIWTPGDAGGFGKLPSIDVNKTHLAYFNTVYDGYPLLNNKTLYNVQYLIDQEGQATQPKLSDITFFDVQGTFEPLPEWNGDEFEYVNNAIISLAGDAKEQLFPLQGEFPFYKTQARPEPVLYSQKSGIFPVNKNATEPQGIELVGNQPIDANIVPNFNNYTFEAFGETEIFTSTRNINSTTQILESKTPVQDGDGLPVGGQNNITASAANTGTSLPIYQNDKNVDEAGFTTIPILDGGSGFAVDNTQGLGNNTSQAYDLDFEFFVDSDPTDTRLRTRDHEGGWKGHSPIDSPLIGEFELRFQRRNFNASTDAEVGWGSQAIKGVKVEIIEYFSSTNAAGTNFLVIDYNSVGASYISTQQSNGLVQVNFHTDTIRDAYQNAGYASPIKQRLKISGKHSTTSTGFGGGNRPIRQGDQFRVRYNGNIITNTSGNGPVFFPQGIQSFTGGRILMQGQNSNPVTAATASFWDFSGSGTSQAGNVLHCVSPQLNKAYARDFVQKDLIYTASFNKDFPGGREPFYTTMPPVTLPWELQINDEIRFDNNEDNAYKIINIIPPSENNDPNLTSSDNLTPSLVIELDGSVPINFGSEKTSTGGGSGTALEYTTSSITFETVASYVKVDFPEQSFRPIDNFVIRRYLQDAGGMIVDQSFPYSSNPEKITSAGFLKPPFTTPDLETSPDVILQDLIDKKLI